MSSPRYSVVFATRNLSPCVDFVIRCLEAQTYDRDAFECIIVDDASTDGTAELIKRLDTPLSLRLYESHCHGGLAAARNIGVRASRGEVLVFIDGDVLLDPNWLADVDAQFARGGCDVVSGTRYHVNVASHSGVVASISELLGVDETKLLRVDVRQQFERLHRQARLGHYPTRAAEATERELRALCEARPGSFVGAYSFITANVAVKRQVLGRTRGFDEFVRRGQDIELGIRLWEAGAKFSFARGGNGYHLYSRSNERLLATHEYLGFICRHPYEQVLAMLLWSVVPEEDPVWREALAVANRSRSNRSVAASFRRLFRQPLPGVFKYSESEIVEAISDVTGIEPSRVRKELAEARDAGVLVECDGGRMAHDLNHEINWLRSRRSFRSEELRHDVIWGHRDKLRGRTRQPLAVNYEGECELRLSVAHPRLREPLRLNMPLPVSNEFQRIEITACMPSDLLDYAAADAVRGYPIEQVGEAGLIARYRFACRVYEGALRPRQDGDGDSETSRTSRMDRDATERIGWILRMAKVDAVESRYERAWRLYCWLLDHVRILQHGFGEHLVLHSGIGTCAQVARMFVVLCRVAGVRARERRGFVLTKRVLDDVYGAAYRGSLGSGMHTWAEVDVEDGWLPVDFIASRYSDERNAFGLRQEQWNEDDGPEAEKASWRGYYFGKIDPYRIHVSSDLGLELLVEGARSGTRETDCDVEEVLTCRRVCPTDR